MNMHSRQTVKYICETYPSGNNYYYKQEMITSGSWEDISTLQWGAKRPVTERTFKVRKEEGYKTAVVLIDKEPAVVLQFQQAK
jgi:protein-arginine kinase activator protein McsA